MKGDVEVVAILNKLLTEELTAIDQYVVHAAMQENWGYNKLAGTTLGTAKVEMKHAHQLIDRIIFLEGTPILSSLNELRIGAEVGTQISSDLESETSAVEDYRAAILLCEKVGDSGTRELLEGIIEDEESHVNYWESQRDQIAQMGIGIYLQAQI